MKDSGIEWIGEIPESWKISKVKHGFVRKKEEAHQENPVILSLARSGVKVRDMSKNEGQIAESYYNYNPVIPGDLLLNPMDLYSGANCSISKETGVISPAYMNLRAKGGYCPEFYDYYFKTQYWGMAMFAHGKGVSFENRWTLGSEDLLNYYIPAPSYSEQERIAEFLDKKCGEIDEVIAKTEKTIEEYKALKQSVITEAVTKGIRPNRPMKDSGIEWIGQIPEEWGISRVGLHYDITLGKMLCTNQLSDEYTYEKYFCAANVHFDGLSEQDDLKKMWFSNFEKELYKVHSGDMLVVEGGAGAGGSTIVNNLDDDIYIQNSIMIVRNRNFPDNRYLRYLIEYLVKQGYIDVVCNKATIPHFTKDKLENVPYPVIQNREMIMISDYLDTKCAEIDKLIESKQQLLTELETYKKSVIYEYVTGKKEV